VSLGVIAAYVKAMGGWPTFLLLASWFILAEACRVGATVWLSHWTGVADMPGAHYEKHQLAWYALVDIHLVLTNSLLRVS